MPELRSNDKFMFSNDLLLLLYMILKIEKNHDQGNLS